jgi:tight adherence protein B
LLVDPSLVTLSLFATVTLSLAAGGVLLSDLWFGDASRVRRRVANEFRRGGAGDAAGPALFKKLDQLTLDPTPAPTTEESTENVPDVRPRGFRDRLETLLEQAGLAMSPEQLLMVAVGLGLAMGIGGAMVRGPFVGLPAAAAGAAAPLLFAHHRRRARREKLRAQLPGAFDLMARVIRAGQSVTQALQAVSDSFGNPIAREFTFCQQQQSLGLRPEIAFREMAERLDILELRIFVMALLIQRQAGGNLSEVLDRLAGLLRERQRLRKQVRALTAEGRLQGLTLLVLPVLMFGVMMLVNRKYAEVLLEHHSLLIATGVAMGVGMLWIRKIVSFDV